MPAFGQNVLMSLKQYGEVHLFQEGDVPDIQVFLALFEDFFMTCENTLPDAQELLKTHPPEKDPRLDKGVFGFYEKGHLFGFVDLVKDYPQDGTWTIGYLLVHPHYRRKNKGTSLVKALENLTSDGARILRCIVQKENPGAHSFWHKNGFIPVRTTLSGITVYEKALL